MKFEIFHFCIWLSIAKVNGLQYVSCGSVTKLFQNYNKIRLHSHDVKYGSGSGQQSVTGTQVQEDHNSNWLIKGLSKSPCKRGEPIKCGQLIRLEHLSTKRNLHSHLFTSPLSSSQEISAFGEDGEGDTGDHWIVTCSGEFWERDNSVMFKHADTDMYLGCSGMTYSRPIHGQMEIVGLSRPSVNAEWQTNEGVFIQPTTFFIDNKMHEHSEL